MLDTNKIMEELENLLEEWEMDIMTAALWFIALASAIWCIVYEWNKLNGGE